MAVLFDWCAKTPGKPAPVAQQPRHQKCKLRPDLAEVVLDWGSRQTEVVAGIQLAYRTRPFRLGVFDHLRLVKDHDMPLEAAHYLDVSRQHRVGRDNEIGAADLLAPFVAVEPMPYDEPQIRGELRGLRHPIGNKARWYDNERWAVEPPRGVLDRYVGKGLRGFPQAHIIGEDACHA